MTVVGWPLAGGEAGRTIAENLGVPLVLGAWLGAFATSLVIRRSYRARAARAARVSTPWPTPTARSQQLSVRYALLAYLFTFACVIALAAIFYFGLGGKLPIGAGVLMVDAILICALLPLRRRRGLALEDLGLRTAPAARSFGLAVLGLLAYMVVAALWIAIVRPHRAAGQLANIGHAGTLDTVLVVLGVAVSAPIAEEAFFRGLLYRSLRNRLPILPAALLAGALFGLVHITGYPLDTLPVKAGFGVIACLLYERTGSLLPGIALHWFVDASVTDVAITGNDAIVLLVGVALIALMIVVSLCKAGRRDTETDLSLLPAEASQDLESGSPARCARTPERA
jgi:membrane protease YdiL (CAAX protease family)